MSAPRPAAVIVLAAGEGTRMKSDIPKVLHTIGGRSLVGHAVAAARGTEPSHLAVVVRHQRERVAAHIAEIAPDATIADQDEVKGTGRAAECALEMLPGDLSGTVLVTYGDVPLLATQTLTELTTAHEQGGNAVTVLTAVVPNPTGYGRILRDAAGSVAGIIEHKDALKAREEGTEHKDAVEIREINSGIYAFDAAVLRESLAKVTTDNAQGEKYLTDVLGLAREAGGRVEAHTIDDLMQTEGVNDKVQLAAMGRELNKRIVEQAMRDGAIVIDPATTFVDVEVTIGRDTVVHPNTQLRGATTIGANCEIGPDTTLVDTEVGDGASVVRTQAQLAKVGDEATVGPFSFLRPGTELGAKGKIGGFVETKNAQIGDGAKVPHLTYCGDAVIGEGANIGAGTIFANYDGVNKHVTHVGAHSFVGSDSVLIAPVTIAPGAYVAAGSAVDGDVNSGQIAVARGRQRNIDGWVERRRSGTKTHEAAQNNTRATTNADPSTTVAPESADEGTSK